MKLDPDAPKHRFDPIEFEDDAWDGLFESAGAYALVAAIVILGVIALCGFGLVHWFSAVASMITEPGAP